MKENRLPEAEFVIMKQIWDRQGPVTSAMLMESVGTGRGWKPQTLLTLLSRLAERGFIRADRTAGREKCFTALISREEYLDRETSCFLDQVHGHSLPSLLASLNSEALNDRDIEELENWFEQLKRGRQHG